MAGASRVVPGSAISSPWGVIYAVKGINEINAFYGINTQYALSDIPNVHASRVTACCLSVLGIRVKWLRVMLSRRPRRDGHFRSRIHSASRGRADRPRSSNAAAIAAGPRAAGEFQ